MKLSRLEAMALLSFLSGFVDTLELAGNDLRYGDFDEAGSLLIDLAESIGNLETMLTEAGKKDWGEDFPL